MRKKLYIISGWKETCRRKSYQTIKNIALKKDYDVECIKVDWGLPLSKQLFDLQQNSTIFGFSLGAIFAWLLAQNSQTSHLILASMTPLAIFKNVEQKKELSSLIGNKLTEDIASNIKSNHKAIKQTILYGEKELDGEKFDILIPNTGHKLTNKYIKAIAKII